MLLSKAFSLTASSLLGSESAPASTSFDVYLMILSTCTSSVHVTCVHNVCRPTGMKAVESSQLKGVLQAFSTLRGRSTLSMPSRLARKVTVLSRTSGPRLSWRRFWVTIVGPDAVTKVGGADVNVLLELDGAMSPGFACLCQNCPQQNPNSCQVAITAHASQRPCGMPEAYLWPYCGRVGESLSSVCPSGIAP